MKKNILSFICGLFILVSCTNEEDTVYSCNEIIDSWVKSNLDGIHAMSRKKWESLDEPLKKATYRAFTPMQKLNFWQAKFEEVKKMDWSALELAHIKKAEDYLNQHKEIMYGHLSDDQLDDLELFFYQWACYGEDKFGWTKEIAIAIAGSGNRMLDKKGNIERNIKTRSLRTLEPDVCDCNDGSLSDFCGVAGPCNSVDSKCKNSEFGCGWIWVQECNGTCDKEFVPSL